MVHVEKRDSQPLNSLILNDVAEYKRLANGWAVYKAISLYDLSLEVVIHVKNFVYPITDANTQRSECEWGNTRLLIMKLR